MLPVSEFDALSTWVWSLVPTSTLSWQSVLVAVQLLCPLEQSTMGPHLLAFILAVIDPADRVPLLSWSVSSTMHICLPFGFSELDVLSLVLM